MISHTFTERKAGTLIKQNKCKKLPEDLRKKNGRICKMNNKNISLSKSSDNLYCIWMSNIVKENWYCVESQQ